jgi:hypothetical protein
MTNKAAYAMIKEGCEVRAANSRAKWKKDDERRKNHAK